MIKNVSRRIFLLAALYCVIIFGIFALQFTNGKSFSHSFGSLLVSGSVDSNESNVETPLLPFHAGVNGIDMFLDSNSPLRAFTTNNTSVSLNVTGYKKNDESFSVLFTEGVTVSFSFEKRGDIDQLSVSATMPVKYQKIAFPYKIARSASLESRDSQSLVFWGKQQFVFSGNAQIAVEPSGKRFVEILRSAPTVYYQTWIPVKGLSLESLASLPTASSSAYSRAIETFAANALVSFKSSLALGSLHEPLIAAYVAEMGRIGMYRSAIDYIPEAWRTGTTKTWLTNTFFNNLERTWAGFILREKDERSVLAKTLSDSNPAAFEFPSLLSYLSDRGSSVLFSDIGRLAVNLNAETLTALQAAGILEASVDASLYAPSMVPVLFDLRDVCERKLKERLIQIQYSLYVSNDALTIDVIETLRIGAILRKYGNAVPEKKIWATVGTALITSLLEFSGTSAEFPSKFSLMKSASGNYTGILARTDQSITTAAMYPLVLYESTWYPKAVSLASSAGAGVWAWSSALATQVTRPSSSTMKFTIRFPQGETHYMVIRGIKAFSRIQIYGIDFRTDPRFESYNSSGYRYDEATETLYLKMRHKTEYEEIVLWFGPVPVSSSSVEPVLADQISTEIQETTVEETVTPAELYETD